MSAATAADPEQVVRQVLSRYSCQGHYYIGFSGGLDSSALLLLAAKLLPRIQLHAIHIDHQLQSGSSQWGEHCRQLCARLQIPFSLVRVSPGSASEQDAREARHRAFAEFIGADDILLLGQHREDQAETLIYRLLRGAGVHGLAGMVEARQFSEGTLVRPLLRISRQQLRDYLISAGVGWIEDPSNNDDQYARNWIRNRLAPLLSSRWSGWSERLSQVARRMHEADQLARQLAEIDVARRPGACLADECLEIDLLLELSPLRQKNLLYYWLTADGELMPGEARVAELQQQLALQGTGYRGEVVFGAYAVRGHDGALYRVSRGAEALHATELVLSAGIWPLGSGSLSLEPAEFGLKPGLRVSLRPRCQGDQVRIAARGGRVSIKKLMNEQKIPPWLRNSWPLICVADQIIAIPGIWIDPEFSEKPGLQPKWCR